MTHDTSTVSRRTVLRGAAGAVCAGALAGVPAASAAPSFDGWLSNTSNYDGVVDKTGAGEVTVTVGVDGNGGTNAFGPPAIRVDPGTKVTWKWSGNGYHNVKSQDGSFTSEFSSEKGHTFSQTFEEKGVHKYFCVPHKSMGMRGVVVVGQSTGASASSGASQATPSEPDYGDWFDNVSNYEQTVDETGTDEVTITVGATGNGGNYAFDPPAVRVDPGTTIVWKWSGNGTHNVVAADGSFESDLTGEAGHTFEQTVESGITKYYCVPHKPMGMKGAIVVDDGSSAPSSQSSDANTSDLLTIGGGVGLSAAILGMFGAALRGRTTDRDNR